MIVRNVRVSQSGMDGAVSVGNASAWACRARVSAFFAAKSAGFSGRH